MRVCNGECLVGWGWAVIWRSEGVRRRRGAGFGRMVDEAEVHFVRDTEVAVPDLAGWRRERLPIIPED